MSLELARFGEGAIPQHAESEQILQSASSTASIGCLKQITDRGKQPKRVPDQIRCNSHITLWGLHSVRR